jgi:DNA-binding response OmpR family regulator
VEPATSSSGSSGSGKPLLAQANGQRPVAPRDAQTILLVEDEQRLSAFLSRALTSCGFQVTCAEDGAEAMELVDQRAYDLVLLDLLLPGFDGFDVLRHISESRPIQEVIALSALSDVETKLRCFELGATDFVSKPFVLAELVARIRLRMRRALALNAERMLVHGPLRLDRQRHIAIVDDRSIVLSTREFLLLEYLIRHRGEVCTRRELLGSVWGISFETRTNVVDVYVGRLRAKLGNEVVETVRSVGYSCSAVA